MPRTRREQTGRDDDQTGAAQLLRVRLHLASSTDKATARPRPKGSLSFSSRTTPGPPCRCHFPILCGMSETKRILVVGHGRAGKDTACEYLASITTLRFAGTTSLYLARYVAARLGVPEQEAYRTRHQNRNLWHRVGNEVRRQDPGLLVRESLAHADIIGGVRDLEEIKACREEDLVDLIVWIANDRAPKDSTVTFGERDCDVTVPNHWTLEEFPAATAAVGPLRRPARADVRREGAV